MSTPKRLCVVSMVLVLVMMFIVVLCTATARSRPNSDRSSSNAYCRPNSHSHFRISSITGHRILPTYYSPSTAQHSQTLPY